MSATSFTLLTQIMIGSVAFTFFVVGLLFLFHIYSQWYWSRTEDSTIVAWRRRAARQGATTTAPLRRGLKPSALKSLPVVEYNPNDFKDGLECAVCLSELSQGEKARILPKCNHGFHVECIDMWFKSHSTCPLCRTLVVPPQNSSSLNPKSDSDNNVDDELQEEISISLPSNDDAHGRPQNPAFPTNVLFWGDDTEVRSLGVVPLEEGHDAFSSPSTSRDHRLVIEVPTEPCEDCLCSTPHEGKSPIMTKLRSLKRLLSRGKRVAMAHSPRGSSSGDAEQV